MELLSRQIAAPWRAWKVPIARLPLQLSHAAPEIAGAAAKPLSPGGRRAYPVRLYV